MKILIIDNASITRKDGRLLTGQHNGVFLRDLMAKGHAPVWFQNVRDDIKSLACFDLEENGIRTVYAPSVSNKYLRYILAYIRLFYLILISDFVYFYYPSSFKYGAIICRVLFKPYGLYVRGMNDLDSRLSKYIQRHAKIVLTVSDYFTNKITTICKDGKVETIRPMLSLTDKDIDRTPRNRFTGDVVRLLYLGRIDPDKGINEIIDAVVKLNEQTNDKTYKLDMVGNGHYLNEAKARAADNPNITFHGPVYDPVLKKQFYQAADLYVLSTYHEGFPRTLYEAMAYGTPIITTMVGGIPTLMQDGINCLSIEVRSSESIVEKVRFAVDNSSICEKIRENGFETVSSILDGSRPSHGYQLAELINKQSTII